MLSFACFPGEIVYQDYLGESALLSEQDRKMDAWVNVMLDWNYLFESNSLAVALKMQYGPEVPVTFRPIVVRYDFNGVHEPVGRSIRRADTCYRHGEPAGFCMVGLDSFLFSYGERQRPKSAYMCLSASTQTVADITREVDGKVLHGALSASERAVFPDGGGFAFQCVGDKRDKNTKGWGLLLWNKGEGSLWPSPSLRRGYTCLSDGRVLLDVPKAGTKESWSWKDESWFLRDVLFAQCHQVLPRCNADRMPNVYADWDAALSNNVMALGEDVHGGRCWSIDLHGMAGRSSNNELGHDLVEGKDVLYDFCGWKIFRIRRNDADWQVFDLQDYFREDVDKAEASVEVPILHRGAESWYYALLFKHKNPHGGEDNRYGIRIVEVSHQGAGAFLWSFPDFNTAKKLTTWLGRSPGAIHKLPDDSWVFLSNTATFTNDAIFVQLMAGSRKAITPDFKSIDRPGNGVLWKESQGTGPGGME